MIYLFAAFACVWIGIFLYLYLLGRRTEALAHEVAVLRDAMRREQSETVPYPAAPGPAVPGRPRSEPR